MIGRHQLLESMNDILMPGASDFLSTWKACERERFSVSLFLSLFPVSENFWEFVFKKNEMRRPKRYKCGKGYLTHVSTRWNISLFLHLLEVEKEERKRERERKKKKKKKKKGEKMKFQEYHERELPLTDGRLHFSFLKTVSAGEAFIGRIRRLSSSLLGAGGTLQTFAMYFGITFLWG